MASSVDIEMRNTRFMVERILEHLENPDAMADDVQADLAELIRLMNNFQLTNRTPRPVLDKINNIGLKLVSLALSLLLYGCSAKANSGTHVSTVGAPLPGYTCFVIQDSDDKPIGGNCVKE